MEPDFAAFMARLGPLKVGTHANGTKLHAVRANGKRAWCGRTEVTPGALRWNPEGTPNTLAGGLYCGQCMAVWQAARARNQEIENLLTEVEKLYVERKQREHSRTS